MERARFFGSLILSEAPQDLKAGKPKKKKKKEFTEEESSLLSALPVDGIVWEILLSSTPVIPSLDALESTPISGILGALVITRARRRIARIEQIEYAMDAAQKKHGR